MNRNLSLLFAIIIVSLALAACGAPAPTAPAASAAEAPLSDAPASEAAIPAESASAITETADLTDTEVTETDQVAGTDTTTATDTTTGTEPATETEAITETVADESATTAVRGVRTFVIIPSESTASYIADEEFFADALAKYGINAGRQDTIGTTQEISGRLTLDLDNLSDALGENTFTVQLNTLESDQGLRDGYIRNNGPRFNAFPEAIFVATAIEGAPATYNDGDEVNFRLIGDITIRNITAPATFDVAARLTGDILTGVAETNLKMSDFGIEPLSFLGTLTVADDIGVKVEFTAQAE